MEISGKKYETTYFSRGYYLPPWAQATRTLTGLTPEKLNEMEHEATVADELNAGVYREKVKKLSEVIVTVEELFGHASNAYKYVKKLGVSAPPNYSRKVAEYRKSYEEEKEKVIIQASQKEDADAKIDLVIHAVQYLVTHERVLATDFTVENAVSKADDLAFVLEVERIKSEHKGEFIPFNGANCDGPCAGWDMIDRRCQCGNRRVGFVAGFDHSFLNPSVEAEAY